MTASRPRLLLVSLILVVIAAACGDETTTSGFEADVGPIAPDLVTALGDGQDPDAVPEVQRNFLNGCVKGFEDAIPELEPVQRAGLLQVCGCTYEAIVSYSYAQAVEAANQAATPAERTPIYDDAAFNVFTEVEGDLRSDGALTEEVEDLIRGCIREEAGL